jgi:hypothetical protein
VRFRGSVSCGHDARDVPHLSCQRHKTFRERFSAISTDGLLPGRHSMFGAKGRFEPEASTSQNPRRCGFRSRHPHGLLGATAVLTSADLPRWRSAIDLLAPTDYSGRVLKYDAYGPAQVLAPRKGLPRESRPLRRAPAAAWKTAWQAPATVVRPHALARQRFLRPRRERCAASLVPKAQDFPGALLGFLERRLMQRLSRQSPSSPKGCFELGISAFPKPACQGRPRPPFWLKPFS